MAILSGNLLISSLSLFHLTIAYFLHTSPATVTRHGMVFILSSAFKLPVSPSLTAPSAATTLLACVLSLLGLSDLFAANLPEEVGVFYWATQAPLRAFFFFVLTGWGWLAGPKGLQTLLASGNNTPPPVGGFTLGAVSEGVVFSWAFLETMMWFWIFITLRDERREMMVKRAAQLEREAQN